MGEVAKLTLELDESTGEVSMESAGTGWSEKESGLPVFHANSIDAVKSQLGKLRGVEGEATLRLAAVLTAASEGGFYGEGTLKQLCEEEGISYSKGGQLVSGYKRLRELEIFNQLKILRDIRSGRLGYSFLSYTSAVKDDEQYTELLSSAANGELTQKDVQQRVKEIRGKTVGIEDKAEAPKPPEKQRERVGPKTAEQAIKLTESTLVQFIQSSWRVKELGGLERTLKHVDGSTRDHIMSLAAVAQARASEWVQACEDAGSTPLWGSKNSKKPVVGQRTKEGSD